MVLKVKFQKKHGGGAFRTFEWVITEGSKQTVTPTVEGQKDFMFFLWDGTAELFVRRAVAGINAIIPDHFKIRFRDMANQSFYELQCRNRFVNELVIFVSVVVEGDRIAIVFINAGSCDGRTPKISANVLGDDGRIAEVWLRIDVETIFLIAVYRGFDFFERVSDMSLHFVQKSGLKGFPEQFVAEVFKRTPSTGITNATFGNEAVDMRIPFQVTTEGVKDTDKAGSKTLGFVSILEHSKDDAADGREKAVKE